MSIKIKLRPAAKAAGSKSPTTASRKALAGAGQAMPGGRYPIPNVDFLKRAIRSIGRTPPDKRAAVVAWIKKRAAALGQPKLAANLSNLADQALELANARDALELAGAATGGGDVEPMGNTRKEAVQSKPGPGGLKSAKGKGIYAKLRKRGLPHSVALKAAKKAEAGLNVDEMSNSPKV